MLRIDFVTLFPELVLDAVAHSILQRASDSGLVKFGAVNPREFATDAHRTVDDDPYGGGPGMLMKPDVVAAAIESLPAEGRTAVVLTDPTGTRFNQGAAAELATFDHVILICGHYEGIDDRVRSMLATHVVSLGDFVLTGGELPALVIADALTRLLPGALGCDQSLGADSHSDGLLSAPQYTRPANFRDADVPAVLSSGNHGAIADWKRTRALMTTRKERPDLFWKAKLDKRDLKLLGVE